MTDHTPPADPWSGNTPALGSPTVAYARSGHTQAMPIVVPGPPRRSRAVILLSVGVVVALIAGVSAYLGASFWYGWSITEPEEVMPADTAVYLRLDLSPGLGQRLALGRIAAEVPARRRRTRHHRPTQARLPGRVPGNVRPGHQALAG